MYCSCIYLIDIFNWCLFTYILQQEKIQALQLFADQLIGGEHYDSGAISDKRDQVLDRYVCCYGDNNVLSFWFRLVRNSTALEFLEFWFSSSGDWVTWKCSENFNWKWIFVAWSSLRANPLARSPGQAKLESAKWKLWTNLFE